MYSRRQFHAFAFAFFNTKRRKLAGIEFEVIRNGQSSRRYLLIHGNEETAREVLRDHMKGHLGTAHLVAGHERMVPVDGGKLDPNRLFTREGAERNLKRLNPSWPEAQLKRELDRLDKQRDKLIQALLPPEGGLLVAVHNNSEGYSVNEEVPISNATSIRRPKEPHEFFLATSAKDYEKLAKSPYNVVLQNKPTGEEDGSLSRLMANRGLRYVNLEVGLGKKEIQREMLEWLEANVP